MGNNRKAQYEKYAIDGGDIGFHHTEEGGLYGTHEYEKTKQGSHAPDMRVTRGLGSNSLRSLTERMSDKDADAFLRKHGLDPDNL